MKDPSYWVQPSFLIDLVAALIPFSGPCIFSLDAFSFHLWNLHFRLRSFASCDAFHCDSSDLFHFSSSLEVLSHSKRPYSHDFLKEKMVLKSSNSFRINTENIEQ